MRAKPDLFGFEFVVQALDLRLQQVPVDRQAQVAQPHVQELLFRPINPRHQLLGGQSPGHPLPSLRSSCRRAR